MSIYQDIAFFEKKGEAFAFCNIVYSSGSTPRHEGSKMLVFPDGKIIGTVGGGEIESLVIKEAMDAINDRKNRKMKYSLVDPKKGDPGICGGQVEVYVEPVIPKLTIIIIGAGHVGKQVAHLAKWCGYRVVVCDDRPELCNPQAIPDADEYLICPIAKISNQITINRYTFFIFTTKGSNVDAEGLPPILQSEAGYIGVIGSKRRWELTKIELLNQGISEQQINRVNSPIGLELNAETPEEIAISIISEVLMVANSGTGKMMKAKLR
ncbi:MAG: XdhC family protein [Chloroflexi bacterium]|nr:XdhC family protein [Chloroflexota bacterium]